MAAPKKRTAQYDLKKQDRRRNLLVQLGMVAVVALFAAGLVTYIVTSSDKPTATEGGTAIRVAAPNVATGEDGQPKALLSIYEDALCPACGNFERTQGALINQLVDSGQVAVDYYMVAILDRQGDGYSSRAGAAAYCVADESNDAFRRFHGALYAPENQPAEGGGVYPDDARLTELARISGAVGSVLECISSGRYVDIAKGNAAAAGVNSTPTIRLNGEEIEQGAIAERVGALVGDAPAQPAAAP